MSQLTARIQYAPMYDEFELYLRKKEFNGETFTIKSLEVIKIEPYAPIKPFLAPVDNPGILPKEFCQAILDAAWNEGMRPTGFKDVLNETAAIRYHLEDMRTLVFKKK